MVYLPPLATTGRAHFMDEETLHGECLIMIIKKISIGLLKTAYLAIC